MMTVAWDVKDSEHSIFLNGDIYKFQKDMV